MLNFLLKPEIILLLSLIGCVTLGRSAIGFFLLSIGFLVPMIFSHGAAQIFPSAYPLFDFVVTPLRSLFGELTVGLGAWIGIYSYFYMKDSQHQKRFFCLLSLFEWSCLIVLFSDHLLMFSTGWELTAIFSALLIGFKFSSPTAQRGAALSLLVTLGGGLLLFFGLVLLAEVRGSYSLSILASAWDGGQISLAILFFILVGGFTKAAIFPFQFWLPKAMQAPTPVSAFLHSASLVNLGIFLIAIFAPLLEQNLLFHILVTGTGLLTFALCGFLSLYTTELKIALASTTSAQLGLILTCLGLRNPSAIVVAKYLLISHALYKSALFLSVGVFQKLKGTQDRRRLQFLWSGEIALFIAIVICIASMLGLPWTLGSFGKSGSFYLFSQPIPFEGAKWFTRICFTLGSFFTAVFGGLLFFSPLSLSSIFKNWKGSRPSQTSFHPYLISVGALALASLAGAFFISSDIVLESSAQIWAGLCIVLGFATAYFLNQSSTYDRWTQPRLGGFSFARWLEKFFLSSDFLTDRCARLSDRLERWMADRAIPLSLGVLFIFLLFPARTAYQAFEDLTLSRSIVAGDDRFTFFSICIFICGLMAIGAATAKVFLHRIIFLGFTGAAVILSFAAIGAPDLVLTQGLLEIATLVLWIAVWLKVRDFHFFESRRDLMAWIFSAGLSIFVLGFFFLSTDFPLTEVDKVTSRSFFELAGFAGGQNLVNLILVDYRGLDTLGEISVFFLAFLGILYWSPTKKTSAWLNFKSAWAEHFKTFILWLFTVASIALLIRGHHAPGGGFIGGVFLALGILFVFRFTAGEFFALFLNWRRAAFNGILIAGISSILPLVIGKDFFQSFPTLFGPSSLLFDAGVFLTVLGSSGGILEYFFGFAENDEVGR